ncbi:phage portal protein [Streptomyces sp. NPDC057654]|uniref:phage portal protein n=1 Tax=Streptomyces sp. NPDC057654 TaxID=3346196 RepID=UPI0036B4DDA5
MIVPPSGYTAVGPPETPLDWLAYLYGKLTKRLPLIQGYGEYYEGEQQQLAFAQLRYREEFREVFAQWRDNFCGLIVDSSTERLGVDGFRMPDATGTDRDARFIWQRNSMDAFSNSVHLDALVQGQSFILVWADKHGQPAITPVSAEHMAIQYKPGSLAELEAAARFYHDDWGRHWVTLWTSTYVYEATLGTAGWEQGVQRPNPLGVVPVVPFTNRTRLVGSPHSDLANIVPIQDAINKVVSDALTASEFAAFPQRYVTGLEIQEDEDGRPIEPFRVAVDKLLQAEDPAARFGSFTVADLGNYVTLVSMLVQHMASISRVPPTYFLVNAASAPSGESILSFEAGLVAKVRQLMLYFGESWEQVIRLCFAVKRDKRARAFSMETTWRDPEYRTEAQHVDALLKLKQLNVPEEQLWSDAGYSPAQIATFREMRKADARAAAEIARLEPQPKSITGVASTPNEKKAAEMASKIPQGNSGNINRKLNEQR